MGSFIIRKIRREGTGRHGTVSSARGCGVNQTRKYAKVALEYDNWSFKALKDGVSRVILTRVSEGPIRTNDMLVRTDESSSKS